MMINIAICDDDKYFLDYISCNIEEVLKDEEKIIAINKFTDGIELLESLRQENTNFDIIFLDINMPNMDGIEVADAIRRKDNEVLLIFLTSMEDKVYQTFKYNIFRFIRKMYIDTELVEALQSAMEVLKDEKYIFQTIEEEIRLYLREILYFEFIDRVVSIRTFSRKYKTNIRRFKDIEDIFLSKGFVSIHRGCIINENYIKSIGNLYITLDTEEKLSVSRYKIEEVKKAFIRAARRG